MTLPGTIETGTQTTSRQLYLMLGRLGGLSVVFEPTFRETPAEVALRDQTLRQALDTLATASQTFYKVTAPKTITVIPDTPAKRREYIDEHVRTFYVSNLDMKEVIDLLRVAGDVRKLQATSTNTLTVADTPERLETVSKILAAIDKARPEVIVEVEILEVNRASLREYGLQLTSEGGDGPDGDGGQQHEPHREREDRLPELAEVDVRRGQGLAEDEWRQDEQEQLPRVIGSRWS